MQETDLVLRGDSIRLGQCLKLADAVDQGSDAKVLLVSGSVAVNGEVETRRGRRLVAGDVVAVGRSAYTLVAGPVEV